MESTAPPRRIQDSRRKPINKNQDSSSQESRSRFKTQEIQDLKNNQDQDSRLKIQG